MEVVVTFDSSTNHPHLRKVQEVLSKEKDSSHQWTSIEGFQYIRDAEGVHVRLSQALGGLPSILQGIPVRRVYIKEAGKNQPPQMGYFRSAGAEGWVKLDPYALWMEDDPEGWQLEVVAPSFDQAKQLYIEMRHNNARPARAWGEQVNVPVASASPLDTLSPFAPENFKTETAIQHLNQKLEQEEITTDELIEALHKLEL